MSKLYVIQGATERGGIYDYCTHLYEALEKQGVTIVKAPVLTPGGRLWPYIRGLFAFVRDHRKAGGLFHLHYPGWQQVLQYALVPQLLCIYLLSGRRTQLITTIHDLSKFNCGIRSVFLPILLLSHALVFTTETERDTAWRMTRWCGVDIRRHATVIPVGCNMQPADPMPAPSERSGVVYFGHIRPGKGIEKFLDVAERMLHKHDMTPFYLIGNLENWDFARYRYASSVIDRLYHLPEGMRDELARCRTSAEFARQLATLTDNDKRLTNVTLMFDKDIKTISRLIAICRYALMLFDDGASMRRGSLQAVLANRCITLTNWSDQTDKAIKRVTLEAGSLDNIVRILCAQDDHSKLLAGIDNYMKVISWDNIAAMYREFLTRQPIRRAC